MNREIKFRAWDKVKSKLRDVVKLNFGNNVFDVMLLEPTESAPENWTLRKYNQIVLLQFIGFKDKNEKEIYEGDYVTCNEFTQIKGVGKQVEGEIVYCDNMGCFGVRVADEEIEGNFATFPISHFAGNFEVIGNVYEHPQLLN